MSATNGQFPRSCAPAIAALAVMWPEKFSDQKAEMYGRMLSDLEPGAVIRAVERLVKGSEFLPKVATIRREVAEESLSLPSAEEAWDIVQHGDVRRSIPEIRAACDAVGGRRAILLTENLSIVRAQFLKSYEARREATVQAFTGARIPLAPPETQPRLGPTMETLPETERFEPRPVHLRWLRRFQGMAIGPPTEAEQAHAIRVLEAGPSVIEGDPDPIYVEAERIFMEAGS